MFDIITEKKKNYNLEYFLNKSNQMLNEKVEIIEKLEQDLLKKDDEIKLLNDELKKIKKRNSDMMLELYPEIGKNEFIPYLI